MDRFIDTDDGCWLLYCTAVQSAAHWRRYRLPDVAMFFVAVSNVCVCFTGMIDDRPH